MSDFTLDTSGAVTIPIGTPQTDHRIFWTWTDLSSLEQGAVQEAARQAWADPAFRADFLACWGSGIPFTFQHFAPRTLGAIRKDCAAFALAAPNLSKTAHDGEMFWVNRQRGSITHPPFPPFPPFLLTDDGLVYHKVSS